MIDPTPAPGPGSELTHQRRWVPALAVAAGVVAVAALGAGALGILDDEGPAPVAAPSEEASSGEPSAPAAVEPSESAEPSVDPSPVIEPTGPEVTAFEAQVWYVTEYRPGQLALVPETVELTGPEQPDPQEAVTKAVEYLLTSFPEDPDYVNGFWGTAAEESDRPAPSVSVDVQPEGTTVDISAGALSEGLGSEYATLAVQQLVQTIVANGGTEPVTVLVDGQSGVDAWGVLVLGQPEEVDPSVRSLGWITSPDEGAVVDSGTITVEGAATGFEGEVDWEVIDAAEGGVVRSGFTSAGANGELGDIEFTVDLMAGEFIVRLFDASEAGAGEGPPVIFEDTKTFSVR